jgi:hypothetical protein
MTAHPAQVGYRFAQELDSFGGEIRRLVRQAGSVAAGTREARDEAVADRIRRCCEHDRSSRRHLPCRHNICRARRDDDFDLEADELFRDLDGTFRAPLRPAILDRNGATFDPAELVQSPHKRRGPLARDRSINRA